MHVSAPDWGSLPDHILSRIVGALLERDPLSYLAVSHVSRLLRRLCTEGLSEPAWQVTGGDSPPPHPQRNAPMTHSPLQWLSSKWFSSKWFSFVTVRLKLPLAAYKLTQPSHHQLYTFPCFHLQEYGPDYIFWPNSRLVFESLYTPNGKYVMVSFETSSRTCSFTKLPTSTPLRVPRDSEGLPFGENDTSQPWAPDWSKKSVPPKPLLPTFDNYKYRLCLYPVAPPQPPAIPNPHTSIDRITPTVTMSFSQPVTRAFMSSDNGHLAVAFYGLVHVYQLEGTNGERSLRVFERQYPSEIRYLGLLANAEILFVQSMRLGGLLMINLILGEEVDFPHYRLDLSMTLNDDYTLSISGPNETFIYGLPSEGEEKQVRGTKRLRDSEPEVSLWSYFKYTLAVDYSAWGSQLCRLEASGTFVGTELILATHHTPALRRFLIYLHQRFVRGLEAGGSRQDFMRGVYKEPPGYEAEEPDEEEHVVVPLLLLPPSESPPLFDVSPCGRRVALVTASQLFIFNTSAEALRLFHAHHQSGVFAPMVASGPGDTPVHDPYWFHAQIDFTSFLPACFFEGSSHEGVDQLRFASNSTIVLYCRDRSFKYTFSSPKRKGGE